MKVDRYAINVIPSIWGQNAPTPRQPVIPPKIEGVKDNSSSVNNRVKLNEIDRHYKEWLKAVERAKAWATPDPV